MTSIQKDLIDAADRGDVDGLAAAWSDGVNLNFLKSGLSPLAAATQRGHLEAMQWLVEHGASVNFACERTHSTPLHHAIQGSYLDAARWLLEQKADVNSFGWGLSTPLMTAAIIGSVAGVKLLLENKADPKIRGRDLWFQGLTAFNCADKHSEIQSLLKIRPAPPAPPAPPLLTVSTACSNISTAG